MISDETEVSAKLLKQHNQRKAAAADPETLRPTQQQAIADIQDCIKREKLVNLVGESGSGKTFLAWYLTLSTNEWSYYPWLPVKESVKTNKVFVDNVAPTREAARRSREIITFDEATSVVMISKKPIPESSTVRLDM